MTVELAAAYISLLPSARGIENTIGRELAGLPQVFGKVGDQAGAQMEKGVKNRVSNVTKLIGAVGVGTLLRGAFAEAAESQKVGAQTVQVIKSTGSAANVTAGQVGSLATSISNYAGIDDEAVQAGENMLLTFTNVRNEAGKGNDIFDQATKILVDMSVAMGTDAKSGAIQLGKALNDPIKGITALTRVGVTFDDQQKKQIATMVQAGNVAGAQRIILAELNKEFGGSAAAQATAADKAKVAWGNLQEQLGTTLMPAVTKVANVVTRDLVPALSGVIHFVQGNETEFKTLAIVIGSVWAAMKVKQGVTVLLGSLQSVHTAFTRTATAATTSSATIGATSQAGAARVVAADTEIVAANRAAAISFAGVLGGLSTLALVGVGAAADQASASGQLVTAYKAVTNSTDTSAKAILAWAATTKDARGQVIPVAQVLKDLKLDVDQLAVGVSGSDDEFQKFKTGLGSLNQVDTESLKELHKTFKDTATSGSDAAGVQKKIKDAIQKTLPSVGDEVSGITKLNDALDRMSNKNISAAQAQLTFLDGLGKITSQVKDNGTTLDLNTQAGRDNERWLLDEIQNVNQVASAQANAGASTAVVTGKMRTNEAALRNAALAAGFNKREVDALIRKYEAVPSKVATAVTADTAGAVKSINAVRDALGRIATRTAISVQFGSRGTGIGANAAGTDYWRGGMTWVGERGRELVNLPRGSQVLDNRRSEKLAGASGRDVAVTVNSYNTLPQPEYVSAVASLRAAANELGRN